MSKLKLKAYGKINLSLDILRKREDGYHDLSMVMQNVSLYDEISIDISQGEGISIQSNDDELPLGEENIAYKAAIKFLNKLNAKLKVNIYIDKSIPKEGGMGGGSADAAAVLVGLNILTGQKLTICDLKEIGSKIGADVPFFIEGGTALAEGKGDEIKKISTPDIICLIIKPSQGVSTVEAYRQVDLNTLKDKPNNIKLLDAILKNDIEKICENMGNVFYSISSNIVPEIKNAVEFLSTQEGCVKSMMTGSGSTVFGIFDCIENAKKAKLLCEKNWDKVYEAYSVDRGIEIS